MEKKETTVKQYCKSMSAAEKETRSATSTLKQYKLSCTISAGCINPEDLRSSFKKNATCKSIPVAKERHTRNIVMHISK